MGSLLSRKRLIAMTGQAKGKCTRFAREESACMLTREARALSPQAVVIAIRLGGEAI